MRLAATVILARPAAGAPEIFMLRRSGSSAFAPDAFVFPGGTVDPGDRAGAPLGAAALAEFRANVSPELPSGEEPISADDASALLRAAVRELAEEASVTVAIDRLSLFSHWITPPAEPRRYNTHFFVAAAPPDQLAQADTVETHDGIWIGAGEALDRFHNGTFYLVYPTIKHLERLRDISTVDELLTFARHKPIFTIMPAASPAGGFAMPASLEGKW